ncbi:hypothetical protein [Amycolatopsis alba]|uniref:Uncharacterized protein n=1 Tax=Amycolatopsis alba DSM 44262 TaxID=1125972 RepID=A0A229RAC4_AMYAL|nr:hypothetical protein [Amycolatopsis alba]OXM43429.1 hypothetical protein CFP75_38290 [Amycolatopsis alba DSM 44262]
MTESMRDKENEFVRHEAGNAIGEYEALTAAGVADPIARQQATIGSPLTYDGRTVAEHAISRYTHLLDQPIGRDDAREHAAAATSGALTDFHDHDVTAGAYIDEELLSDLEDPLIPGADEELGGGLSCS